jgi:hypothetical protein
MRAVSSIRARRGLRFAIAGLVLAFELGTALLPGAPAQAQVVGIRDYPVPGGWFYSQESRMPTDQAPYRGYTVVDDQDASFWTEFRRFGGVDVLGFPVSRRYRYPDPNTGYLSQAFQRGILQWQPETGRAQMANVFEQFTEQGRDDALEIAGIPRPQPGDTGLSFTDDAERRMALLSEPRFLARYFFDPVSQSPYMAQEQAWDFFGLPQTAPERPIYYREKANGKFGAPLYLPYVAQRFQKAGLQLFLADVPLDPTIVPGDGKKGCIAITAIGRLARRLGAGRIIPSIATQPEPLENPPKSRVTAYVPPADGKSGSPIEFELVGTGFQPGEPVTIKMTPMPEPNQLTSPYPVVVSRVDATDDDGSFDQMITARVLRYKLDVTGEWSHMVLDPTQDPTIDLSIPSADVSGTAHSTYC